MPTTARAEKGSSATAVVHLAFELGAKEWKLGFTTGLGRAARERAIGAGDLGGLEREMAAAKRRFGVAEDARVVSCYEAGREGFWLHRWLVWKGIENHVVDSSSIEVNRRQRRRKTDKLDLLWGWHDIFFDLDETLSWKKALPRMEAHILDGPHFLLETHPAECTALMSAFVRRVDGLR